MQETYIDILLQSLNKKEEVLKKIIRLDELQKEQLADELCPAEDFDATAESKAKCIEQLDRLDSGFQKVYDRVSEEMKGNKEAHAEQIRAMQESIRKITDLSIEIQAQEARNKELMIQRFSDVKEKAKSLRTSGKAADEYYKNMMKLNHVDPQFMEIKK